MPSDGTPHLANQPNPITIDAADQPESLGLILQIAASPTRSAIVPMPSRSMDSTEEVDGADNVRQDIKELMIEQPNDALPEVNEMPAVNVVSEAARANDAAKKKRLQ